MEEGIKFFVGLDVHKDSIAVAVAEAGRTPARLIGSIAHDVGKLRKLLARYGEPGSGAGGVRGGPDGLRLAARAWRGGAIICQVIAPSLIPRRAGDRVKTDGRDGLRLAELARSGELRAVWIPDPADEAIRDLASGARGRGQRPHPSPAAAQGLPAAPRRALRRQDLVEQDLSTAGWRR